MKTFGAIILAAGKGTRMNMVYENKVVLPLADKPMIQHIVEFIKKIKIETTVVVVGFAKESVMEVLKGFNLIYAEQIEPLGTGHALICALNKLPEEVENVFVVYGDDAVLYAEENIPIIKKLFEVQESEKAAITFLTIEQDNPYALGRIVRNAAGDVSAIIEEKDATTDQRKITEINPGCFVFSVRFLQKYLSQIEKSSVTGEYYINNFIDIALRNNEPVKTIKGGKLNWRGVNTPEELNVAEKLLSMN